MEQGKIKLAKLEVGEAFDIGGYDFIVLEQDGQQGRTMVISKGIMKEQTVFDVKTRNYGKSALKELIETKIQPLIEKAVGKENVIEHEVKLTSVDMQNEFDPVICKVRPVTFDEARKYNSLLADESLTNWWWTCTPWSTEERGWRRSIAVVCPSGVFGSDYYYNNCGVRPFCILNSYIFVSKGEK